MKKWIIGKPDTHAAAELAKKGGIPLICASVLTSRGIDTFDKARGFFNEDKDNGAVLSDPFLIADMPEAANVVSEAVDNGDLICVYGDYDCDGITSTALLYSYLECLGGNVIYHINMRDDGYGLCERAIRELAEKGVKLIVTVDNGISAIDEAELIYELGMRLVITDHHQPGKVLPRAEAVVDPHRSDCPSPFKDLCGCGVALKLIAAMDGGDYSSAVEQFSDLAAIATIADIVPLTGENRGIVIQGLHYLENTENIGLKALIERAGVKKGINSTAAAFSLAPRINASGRFGSAADAVKLLLCDDYDEARRMAEELEALNNDRKAAEKVILDEVTELISQNPDLIYDDIIVLSGSNWHHGVIGIVAARLVEKFGKPVFIMSDDGDEARGSARSVEGFSIYGALDSCSELLTKFGGHTGAGGFSLLKENIPEFRRRLNLYAEKSCENPPVYTLHADKLLEPTELNVDTIKDISKLEPFGEGNKQPVFLLHGVRLLETLPLSSGAHTKLRLTYGNSGVYGLMFGQKTAEFTYRAGDMLDILAVPEINVYNGQTSVNLRIVDLRLCGISQQKYFNAKHVYEKYKCCGVIDKKLMPIILPKREDFEAVFKLIPRDRGLSCDYIFSLLDTAKINYCKFRIVLDIFAELGLIKQELFSDTVTAVPVSKKADINSSEILKKLNSIN